MRKIYSILLVACSVLISVNIQAKTWEVSTWNTGANDNQLLYAWENASNGDSIKLTNDITMGGYLWLKTATMNDERPVRVVDLNNHTLTGAGDKELFILSHGKLDIVDKSVEHSRGELISNITSSGHCAIVISGSTKKDVDPSNPNHTPYSHLTIGAYVKVSTASKYCVMVDVMHDKYLGNTGVLGENAPYNTNVYTSAYGMANGVRLDIYGHIVSGTYGINVTGNVRSPKDAIENSWNSGGMLAEVTDNEEAYRNASPYVYIHAGAIAEADATSKKATGVYAAGYARWLIEGTAKGNVGAYVKSGDVVIDGGTIESTNKTGEYTRPVKLGAGIEAGGTAVVVESNDSYSGDINVTVKGNATVTGGKGYAIDEIVNTENNDTKVDHLTVESGTFVGGGEGLAIVSPVTTGTGNVTVVGGTYDTDKPETTPQALGLTSGNAEVIETTDEDGKKRYVITTPEEIVTWLTNVDINAAASQNQFVRINTLATGAIKDQVVEGDVTLAYLVLGSGNTIVVKDGASLTIGEAVVENTVSGGAETMTAKITVEAGGKLILTGDKGVIVNSVNGLILEATANKQPTFAISAAVTSNNQPKASVEYYTEAYGMPKTGTSSNYKWDRLTTPLSVYKKVSSNYSTLDPQPALLPGQSGLWTFVEYYDELNSEWVGLNAYSEMQAFTCYALSNNTANGGITYTFEGNLQGNVADNIELDHAGWNYMGNAFIAPIHVKTMLTAIANSGAGIDNSMYLWDMGNQKYIPVNKTQYSYFSAGPKEIPALQTFILKLTSGNSALLDLNYAQSVYNYVINPTAANYSAPQRAIASDVNAFRMNIKSANGEEDDVYMVESGEFSADYDNGADIVKYMNKGINFYAEGEEKYAMVASDNIIGSIFSLQTTEAINYTLTFAEVRGEEYALRDNMTGKTIAIVEGATYNFSAQPNEVAENRFEIVNRDAVTTDINTIVGDNAARGIYTMMGQYVGQDWNALPAGVYVVDGVKVVK